LFSAYGQNTDKAKEAKTWYEGINVERGLCPVQATNPMFKNPINYTSIAYQFYDDKAKSAFLLGLTWNNYKNKTMNEVAISANISYYYNIRFLYLLELQPRLTLSFVFKNESLYRELYGTTSYDEYESYIDFHGALGVNFKINLPVIKPYVFINSMNYLQYHKLNRTYFGIGTFINLW
jgi:hypothetical protein